MLHSIFCISLRRNIDLVAYPISDYTLCCHSYRSSSLVYVLYVFVRIYRYTYSVGVLYAVCWNTHTRTHIHDYINLYQYKRRPILFTNLKVYYRITSARRTYAYSCGCSSFPSRLLAVISNIIFLVSISILPDHVGSEVVKVVKFYRVDLFLRGVAHTGKCVTTRKSALPNSIFLLYVRIFRCLKYNFEIR